MRLAMNLLQFLVAEAIELLELGLLLVVVRLTLR